MKNLNLIQRFSLITLVAMIVFAYAFGKILAASMERHMVHGSVDETADLIRQNVIKHFSLDELAGPKTGDDYRNFKEEIEHLSLGSDIEKIEIWNKDKVVVWASDRDDVGKHFTDNKGLLEALGGKLVSELTTAIEEGNVYDHEQDEQKPGAMEKDHHGHDEHDVSRSGTSEGEGGPHEYINTDHSLKAVEKQEHDSHAHSSSHTTRRLLELYVPLNFHESEGGGIDIVFEIYKNMEPLYFKIEHHRKIIWFWTLIGFTSLYVVLFGIMWNASRRIDRQTKEIRQSKQDWEETFNSITDMITVHDRDFNIISSNKAADKILGLSSHNTELKCYTCFHGTEDAPEECGGAMCVHTGKPSEAEFFEPHLNKYIERRAIPRIDENGQIDGLIHVVRDISDRKRDEALIQKHLNRLNALRSIDKAIIGSVDFNITLDIFLDQVLKHLEIDAASVLLLNRHSQSLEYVVSKGFHSPALKYTKLRLGESNAGRAAIERRIITIPNLREYIDGFSSSAHFVKEDFVTYFAVPLIAKSQVNGVLEIFHRSFKEVDDDWLEFLESIADQGAIAIDNSTLFNELQQSNTELILAYDTTIEGWSRALDLRDKETEGHTQRVSELTVHVARELGVRDDKIVHFRRGALLHDIGKMGVPDNILLKPGPLTDEEWEIMKMHPEYAYQMIYPVEYLRPAIDIPYYHHEKWDGTGYPRGLKGEEIPVSARIFAIIDVWDALRSDRPYRAAWSKEKVFDHILSQSGTHFDPHVVKVFLKVVDSLEKSIVSYSK